MSGRGKERTTSEWDRRARDQIDGLQTEKYQLEQEHKRGVNEIMDLQHLTLRALHDKQDVAGRLEEEIEAQKRNGEEQTAFRNSRIKRRREDCERKEEILLREDLLTKAFYSAELSTKRAMNSGLCEKNADCRDDEITLKAEIASLQQSCKELKQDIENLNRPIRDMRNLREGILQDKRELQERLTKLIAERGRVRKGTTRPLSETEMTVQRMDRSERRDPDNPERPAKRAVMRPAGSI